MEAKDVKTLMEAYASVYEGYGKKKKGDCVSKSEKGAHNFAKKVCHEQYGEGETIFGQHAVPDENGFVSHYDVQFEHGIVEDVSVDELEVLVLVEHPMEGHWYEGETISEEDVFDIIKGHLIGEGYADTEESALAIMANMSEEWRNEIVESMASANRMKEIREKGVERPARSREFEKRLPTGNGGSRGPEFEHGSTRSSGTPSGNLSGNRGRGSRGPEFRHGSGEGPYDTRGTAIKNPENLSRNTGRYPRDKNGNLMY